MHRRRVVRVEKASARNQPLGAMTDYFALLNEPRRPWLDAYRPQYA